MTSPATAASPSAATGTPTVADVRAMTVGALRVAGDAAGNGAMLLRTALDRVEHAADRDLDSWHGEAADAARSAVAATVDRGRANAYRDARLGTVLGRSCTHLDAARGRVLSTVGDIESQGLAVDEHACTVRAADRTAAATQAERRAALRLRAALEAFATADADAAAQIDAVMAVEPHPPPRFGDDGLAGLADLTATIGASSSTPSGLFDGAPAQNRAAWEWLSPRQQAELIAVRPAAVGAADGIPAAIRHRANMHLLDFEERRLTGLVEARRAEYAASPWRHLDGVGTDADERLKEARAKLRDVAAIRTVTSARPAARLMSLDLRSGNRGRAAIALGDPGTAAHIAVTTPGDNTTLESGLKPMVEEAAALRTASAAQIAAASAVRGPEHGAAAGSAADQVSTIAWIGYDTPQVPGSVADAVAETVGEPAAAAKDLWDTATPLTARDGARRLAAFLDGLQAASDRTGAHITALGHSYGSLTTSLALQDPAVNGAVDDAVFYGSPGLLARSAEELGLDPHHAYVIEAEGDVVADIGGADALHMVVPSLGGPFGPDPSGADFVQLSADEAVTDRGRHLDGAQGHGEYTRPGPGGGLRTATYNMAAVVSGRTENLVHR